MAEYKIVDADELDANLTEIADEVRILTDTSDKMRYDEIAGNIAQANADIEDQTDIISQIKRALEGKASVSAAEIIALIDQSGVLGSTDGTLTATEKVEQLIEKVEVFVCAGIFNLKQYYQKESIDFYIDLPYIEQMHGFLTSNQHVKRMVGVNTSRINNFNQAFMNSVIEEIERPFDFSGIRAASNISNAFQNAYYLVEVRFVTGTLKFSMTFSSSVLSAESIQSIIDGLATLAEGAAAQTLTLSKNLPLTEEQKQTIRTAVNNKGWTLAFA